MESSCWDASNEWSPGVAEPKLGGFVTAPAKMSQHPLDNAITNSRNPWKPYSPTSVSSTETRRFVTTEARDRSPRRVDAPADQPGWYPLIAEARDAGPRHGDAPVDQPDWRPLIALPVPWNHRAPPAEQDGN